MKLDDRFKQGLVTGTVLYPFQVFVEEEEQIGMVAQVPGLQEGREKRREID